MIINEIIQTTFGKKPNVKISGLPLIDHGREAAVYKHPNDPHMVIRVELYPSLPSENGYYHFCKAIQQAAESNPYLPRVYDIFEVERDGNKIRFGYVLEKLFMPDSLLHGALSKKSIYRILEQAFGEKTATEVYTKLEKQNASIEQMWEKIGNFINSVIEYPTAVDNDQFAEALVLIKKLIKGGFYNDMFKGNLMIRLTPAGPQLVLIDPVSFL